MAKIIWCRFHCNRSSISSSEKIFILDFGAIFQPANHVDSSSSKTRMLQDVTKKPGDLVAENWDITDITSKNWRGCLASRHLMLQHQESCWDRRRKRCVNLGWKEGEPPWRTLPNILPDIWWHPWTLLNIFWRVAGEACIGFDRRFNRKTKENLLHTAGN